MNSMRYVCEDCHYELTKEQVRILSRCPKCGCYAYKIKK